MANTPPVDPSLNPTRGSWDGTWMNIPGLLPVNIGSSDPYPVNFQSANRGKYTPTNTAWGNAPDNTTQYDPFGTALGPQIGDLLALLTKALSTKPAASTDPAPATPDHITSAPVVPVPAPITQTPPAQTVTPTVTATESGVAIPDQIGSQSSGYAPVNINQPQSSVTPTVSAWESGVAIPPSSVPSQPGYGGMSFLDPNQPGYTPTAADLARMAQTPDLGSSYSTTPVSKTDQIFSTGADNGLLKFGIGALAGLVPGGNFANMAYNAYNSGDANYEAARNGVLPPDWNNGFFGNLLSPASWAGGAIGTSLGKDAGYYDNAPVLQYGASAADASKFGGAMPSDAELMQQQEALKGGPTQMPDISPQLHAAASGEASLNNLQPGGPLGSSWPSASSLDPNQPGYTPTAADLAQWAQTPNLGGQTQFNFNAHSTPNGSGGGLVDAFRTILNLGSNALPFPLNMVPGAAVGGLDLLTGSTPPTGDRTGFFGNILDMVDPTNASKGEKAISWLGNQLGLADTSYIAPTLSGPSQPGGADWNQAVAAARGDSAALNGAYGYQGKDTSLGDIKAQGAALGITGDNPNLFNPYNVVSNNFNNGGGGITGTDGFMGMQLNSGLGGSDLYTGMGANRFFGNAMSGDMGGAGGYGESDIEKFKRMNLGNRWDG